MQQLSRTAILHVGAHKTGSTSIQQFLHRNRDRLKTAGLDLFTGQHIPDNHVELHIAAMRSERMTPYKMKANIIADDIYRANIISAIARFIKNSSCPRLLFSNEGLSYLRHPDEMETLKSMLPVDRVEIIVYTRERAGFLASYAREIAGRDLPQNIDRDSYAYVEADSWLADFAARIDLFRQTFGRDNVTVIDYDAELKRHGSVMPSFLEAIDMASKFAPDEWRNFFLNSRGVKLR